jgi:hypothetical protein
VANLLIDFALVEPSNGRIAITSGQAWIILESVKVIQEQHEQVRLAHDFLWAAVSQFGCPNTKACSKRIRRIVKLRHCSDSWPHLETKGCG